MESLYLDLLKLIFNKLDFLSQIRFRQICKFYYNNLQIIDLYNIDYKYRILLNDKILKNYSYTEYLNASHMENIKNINHMKNLKILDCGWNFSISDKDIIDLNLIELNISNNN